MKVIKIGAIWCNGCLVMRPRWQKIEDENLWLDTIYYDYDQDGEKIKDLNIDVKKLPTFIFLDKNNQEITRLWGEPSIKEIMEIINKNKDN